MRAAAENSFTRVLNPHIYVSDTWTRLVYVDIDARISKRWKEFKHHFLFISRILIIKRQWTDWLYISRLNLNFQVDHFKCTSMIKISLQYGVCTDRYIQNENFSYIDPSGESVCQWPGRPWFNPWLSHTKNSKIVLDTSLLNTQHYKACIKGKVEQSRKRSSPPPYTSVW